MCNGNNDHLFRSDRIDPEFVGDFRYDSDLRGNRVPFAKIAPDPNKAKWLIGLEDELPNKGREIGSGERRQLCKMVVAEWKQRTSGKKHVSLESGIAQPRMLTVPSHGDTHTQGRRYTYKKKLRIA